MTESDTIVAILKSGAALLAVWYVLRILYKDMLIDAFRGQLFTLRDELFDIARDGSVAFDNPAYTSLRRIHNGFIRETNRLGITWVFAFSSKTVKEDLEALDFHEYEARRRQALLSLDWRTQSAITNINRRLHLLVTAFMLLRSPVILLLVLVPLLFVLVFLLVATIMGTRVVDHFSRHFMTLDAAAFARGAQ
jgi:hypothetical protein